MTFGERIKAARKSLNLTQQKFAERIGTTQNNIASYEIGRREPSAAAVNNICKTFGISETWLRTGEGEMFVQQAYQDELTEMVERILTGETSSFKRKLIQMLSKLKEDQWKVLEAKAREIAEMPDTEMMWHPAPASAPSPETAEEKAARLERENMELRRQLAAVPPPEPLPEEAVPVESIPAPKLTMAEMAARITELERQLAAVTGGAVAVDDADDVLDEEAEALTDRARELFLEQYRSEERRESSASSASGFDAG